MSKVVVIDYGAGNLLNVVRALEHCGAEIVVTDKPEPVANASRLVLPGVGTFGDCMKALRTLKLVDPITAYLKNDRPFLGICVGMQVMFEIGEEFGTHEGLAAISGKVIRIPATGASGQPHKIPHIGWSNLLRPHNRSTWEHTILEPLSNVSADTAAYFVHSYMCVPTRENDRLADIDYNGITICAAIQHGNAYGCQFHPEKSGELGLSILQKFLSL